MPENRTGIPKETKVKWISLAVLVSVSLLVTAAAAWYCYQLSAPDTVLNTQYYNLDGVGQAPRDVQRLMSSLSDGCFITGVMLASVGFLTWISSTGFFDMLYYGCHSLKVFVMPFRAPKKPKSFYDYKLEREAGRKKPLNAVLLVGLAYLAIAALFTVLYFNV